MTFAPRQAGRLAHRRTMYSGLLGYDLVVAAESWITRNGACWLQYPDSGTCPGQLRLIDKYNNTRHGVCIEHFDLRSVLGVQRRFARLVAFSNILRSPSGDCRTGGNTYWDPLSGTSTFSAA